jgi:hypothetical protein
MLRSLDTPVRSSLTKDKFHTINSRLGSIKHEMQSKCSEESRSVAIKYGDLGLGSEMLGISRMG